MTRLLYRCLLRLHPAAFRDQFAGEMLWIFDEAAAGAGKFCFFADGCASLARQWLLRTGAWKAAVGGCGAFILIGGMLSMAALPLGRVYGPPMVEPELPAAASSSLPARFKGRWVGYFQFPGPTGQMEFSMDESDGIWTGTLRVRGPDGVTHQGVPEDIRAAGDSLSFRFKTTHGEMVYRGRMIQGQLRGYLRPANP